MKLFINNKLSKIKTINDLKIAYRKETTYRRIKFSLIILLVLLVLYANYYLIFIFLILVLVKFIFKIFSLAFAKWQLSNLPGITENSNQKIGNFYLSEVAEIAEDVTSKMNPSVKMEIKTIQSNDFQMATILERRFLFIKINKYLLIYEGLLYILSKNELKAIIAHETGHHIAPKTKYPLHDEYWSDYYACKYDNPVALANALIKIDQHSYYFNVLLQRCVHLCDLFFVNKFVDYEFWNFILDNVDLPLKSKNDANKKAKQLIHSYCLKKNISPINRNFIQKFFFILKKKRNINILNRKELSKLTYTDWSHYDRRIKNKYLDKYELIDLYNELKNDNTMTISRNHFDDSFCSTHPNTNKRLVFIIENFLLKTSLNKNN